MEGGLTSLLGSGCLICQQGGWSRKASLWLRWHEIQSSLCLGEQRVLLDTSFVVSLWECFQSPFMMWNYTERPCPQDKHLEQNSWASLVTESPVFQETQLALWLPSESSKSVLLSWIVDLDFSFCDGECYVILTGPWGAQTQMLFLWGCFWMPLTFESVDWGKQIALLHVGGPHSINWRPE